MSNGGLFDKVKDFINGNPEKAQQGLDKLGDVINQKTGGKYSEHIDKASDTVGGRLGIPSEQTGPLAGESTPVPGEPAPMPGEPAPMPGEPSPAPAPGQPDPGQPMPPAPSEPAPAPAPGQPPSPMPGPTPGPQAGSARS